jgi:hypothetical protein
MNKFVYIGGIPRSGTVAVGVFIHFHEDAFVYQTTGGPPPQHAKENFINALKHRHTEGNYTPAQYLVPGDRQPDFNEFNDFIEKKNKEWDAEKVFSKKIIGIREDEALDMFIPAKEYIEDREVKFIFPMRMNIKDLIYSQLTRIILGHELPKKLEIFTARMNKAYDQILKIKTDYPDDVLVVGITDSKDRRVEYSKICDFLDMEPNPLQKKWMENVPVINSFNRAINKTIEQVSNHKFYQEILNEYSTCN